MGERREEGEEEGRKKTNRSLASHPLLSTQTVAK
jgi:hypothetical protein